MREIGMIKRKYGDRPNWKRIREKKYSQLYLKTAEFKGYITLLHTVKVTEPLIIKYQISNIVRKMYVQSTTAICG